MTTKNTTGTSAEAPTEARNQMSTTTNRSEADERRYESRCDAEDRAGVGYGFHRAELTEEEQEAKDRREQRESDEADYQAWRRS